MPLAVNVSTSALVASIQAGTTAMTKAATTAGQAFSSVPVTLTSAWPAAGGSPPDSAMRTAPVTDARIVPKVRLRAFGNRDISPTRAAAESGATPAATRATVPAPRPWRRRIPHSPPSPAQTVTTKTANRPATRNSTNPAATADATTARRRQRSPTMANGTAASSSSRLRWGSSAPTVTSTAASAENTPALAISTGRRAPRAWLAAMIRKTTCL